MRYFSVLAWAGRRHQPEMTKAGAWSASRVHYEPEEIVRKQLALMTADRMARTLDEVDAVAQASAKTGTAITVLWVPEFLEDEIRKRVEARRQ